MAGTYNPATGTFTTSNTGASLQGGSGAGGISLGGSGSPQGSAGVQNTVSGNVLPTTVNPFDVQGSAQPGASTATGVDNTAAIAAAKAAALRSQVTALANTVKDIFNSRYGQVDANAQEQSGKLNDRFGQESGDIAKQLDTENAAIGAAHASAGTYDSSYRGNNVDTATNAAGNQVRDLGTELQDNIAKIASWVTSQKAGFDANKGGIDQILAHLADETDPGNLQSIRTTLEGRINDLQASSADNNTEAQNRAALESVAPSSARAVQLKTTLSQILGGTADPATKAAIGSKLIANAGLTGDDAQKLQQAFQTDLSAGDNKDQATQTT